MAKKAIYSKTSGGCNKKTVKDIKLQFSGFSFGYKWNTLSKFHQFLRGSPANLWLSSYGMTLIYFSVQALKWNFIIFANVSNTVAFAKQICDLPRQNQTLKSSFKISKSFSFSIPGGHILPQTPPVQAPATKVSKTCQKQSANWAIGPFVNTPPSKMLWLRPWA